MTLDPTTRAAIALHRFGCGPRRGSIAAIASDPRGALLAELERPGAGLIGNPDLKSAAESARTAFDFYQRRQARTAAERKAARQRAADAPDPVMQSAAGAGDSAGKDAAPSMAAKPGESEGASDKAKTMESKGEPSGPDLPQQIFLGEVRAHFDMALGAELGFVERLVWFWLNHFCVSSAKVPVMSGGYHREAIRPHVLGRFADMLLAVESHPAMLFYLDNSRSIGPESVAGLVGEKGLNENLAREILELHTLGVRAGYTEDDVTSFAKVITGWTFIPPGPDPIHGDEFLFHARMHEPGAQTILGKIYPEGGFEQGRAVLADLARHPATARHVATKLARHFVADDPPPALVDALTGRFRDTEGDLKELAKALLDAPESWAAPRDKLKRPTEWLIAALRATDVTPPDIRPFNQALNLLGEPVWRPGSPKGFSDESATWMDGIAQRIDVANEFARRVEDRNLDPEATADAALGPLATADTRGAIARAESRQQALALLLMAPEFQRR